jgi:DUF971 family protein
VRLIDVQTIGSELALRWDDGVESFIALEKLRRACPCADCQGEVDVMGQLHIGPAKNLRAESFVLQGLAPVGGYALQPRWGDGHATGLFSFEMLRRLATAG